MSGSINSVTTLTGATLPTVTLPATAGTAPAASAADLPAPDAQLVPTGDFGAELAALLVQAGKSARDGDAAARAEAENAEDVAEKAQVDSLRQKASDIRHEGWIDGLSLAGEGACSLSGAMASSSVGQGASKAAGLGFEAAGKFVGGDYKAAQATDDANAASHQADADHAKRAADDENEEMKNERDFVNAAVDFYKQYSDTKAQEKAAVAHGA